MNEKPVLMVDSCADMPAQYYVDNDLVMVPLSYFIGDLAFQDKGIEEDTLALYEATRKGCIPTTSQINSQTFLDIFRGLLPLGRPIIYLAFSSGLSGSCEAAQLAAQIIKEEDPTADITVIDSTSASLGEGLLVWYMVKMRDEGASKEEIVAWLEANKHRLNHWFTVDDLNHLKRGGRISSVAALVGSVLQVKPILRVDAEGRLQPVSKERGRKKSLQELLNKMIDRGENLADQMVFICHGDCLEDAEYLKQLILAKTDVKQVYINYTGPVIGSHSGPGTVAVFFLGRSSLVD